MLRVMVAPMVQALPESSLAENKMCKERSFTMLLSNRECRRKADLFEVVRWRTVPGRKKVEVAERSRH